MLMLISKSLSFKKNNFYFLIKIKLFFNKQIFIKFKNFLINF